MLRPLLLLALLLVALPAWADDEADFRAKPSAALAEKIARTALAHDQVAKAMNWAERIPQTHGATLAQLTWVAKMRADLRWRLNDAGIAPVQVRVTPPTADLLIDGVHVPFHTAMHTLWLPEGVHELEVIAPDYVTTTQSIGARLGEREVYLVDLASSRPPELIVHMVPEGEVIIDGAMLGSSTKGHFFTTPGQHLFELRAKGFDSLVQDLSVKFGEVKRIDVRLKPTRPPLDPSTARLAHQIDRPLLPSEIQQGPVRRIERPTVASKLDAVLGQRARADAATPESQRRAREDKAAQANGAKPDQPPVGESGAAQPETTAQASEPSRASRPSEEPRDGGQRAAASTPDRREPDEGVSERPTSSGPGLSRSAKGWIYGGLGIAAVGAGVAIAYLGAADAETANQLPRGDKTYTDAYSAAAGKTYLGYGVAGLGAVGAGVGAYYLFGNGGLSRKGKGWVLTTLGAVTAVAGGWLMLDAVSLAKDTDANLSPQDPEYTRRFDLAVRNRWIGIGVVGAGAVLVGTGLALVGTAPSSYNASADPPHGREQRSFAWQLQPWLGGNATGASLHVGW